MFLLAFANLYIIIQKSGVQIINHIIIPEKKHENGDNINAEKEFRHFPWIIKLIGLFGLSQYWDNPNIDPTFIASICCRVTPSSRFISSTCFILPLRLTGVYPLSAISMRISSLLVGMNP